MNKTVAAILMLPASLAVAQNPIVPPGVYIADPSARVFSDGKLRIFGALDESTQYYCSWRYHTMETDDMKHWRITENIFASKGEGDEVSYSDTRLSAPDAMERDGKFFLYYCMNQPKDVEGVATSRSPTGPFTDGRPLDVGGFEQIDPSVFIDDDGQAYYLWGQFEAKMAKLQRRLAKKTKGSNRRKRAKLKVARLHAKIADSRRDFLHKLSTRLINENQVIAVESLSVSNMQKNRCLSKSISDASWSEFVRQLEYKANWYGRELIGIDKWYPSSKRCSDCGYTMPKMPLNVRQWTCPECGSIHDRDVNAARNVLAAGLAVSAHGEAVSPVCM